MIAKHLPRVESGDGYGEQRRHHRAHVGDEIEPKSEHLCPNRMIGSA